MGLGHTHRHLHTACTVYAIITTLYTHTHTHTTHTHTHTHTLRRAWRRLFISALAFWYSSINCFSEGPAAAFRAWLSAKYA